MYSLLSDLRYGARMLARSPGFTAIALVTLALGIGVNTAMFSLINGVRGIPQRFEEPEDLVFLRATDARVNWDAVSALDYLDWRAQARSFTDMALYQTTGVILAGAGEEVAEPARIRIVRASGNLLPMLGLDAQLGRLPTPEDDVPGAEGVAVLTDTLWQRRFGGGPDVLGQTILLNDKPHTVIGILPPEFEMESMWYEVSLLTSLPIDPARLERGERWSVAVARLGPGVSVTQAQVEMSGIAARMARAYPESNTDVGVRVQPLVEKFNSPADQLGYVALLAAVSMVLLIACVNLANLLLARATARGREFAVRAALGAGRGRIIRQLLTESLMVALLGGGLGLLVGVWIVDYLNAAVEYLPFQENEVGLNPAMLAYTLLLSLAAAAFFGLAPALAASRVSLSETLKEGGGVGSAGRGRNRLRSALVVGQLAVALPLLICCGLTTRHLIAVRSADFGFATEHLITMRVDLPTYRYTEPAQRASFYRDALETIAALPGIESAGATLDLPLFGGASVYAPVTVEGHVADRESALDVRGYRSVTPDYFSTMRIPLITGRYFTEHDQSDAQQVAIVNERMARHYWPNEDALGKRLTLDSTESAATWITVVGVVANAGCAFYGGPPRPTLYLAHAQQPLPGMIVVARTRGDPRDAVPALRSAIHNLDAGIPVQDFRTVADIVHRWSRDDRMAAGFLLTLAVLALCLASIGLYGVMSYSVAQRTHEIGVRVALGAGRRDILRLVLRRCLVLAGTGTAIGLILAAPVGLAIEAQLFGVSGVDPATFAGVGILLLAVAVLAGYLPARRATKVDPMVALRCE